jgi:hypothetical protein
MPAEIVKVKSSAHTRLLFRPTGNQSTLSSYCQQNGTWTVVDMACVVDPDSSVAASGDGRRYGGGPGVDGGFLVGPNGVNGAKYGTGTVLTIAVAAALISGTAVAFLIMVIRKWYDLHLNDLYLMQHIYYNAGKGCFAFCCKLDFPLRFRVVHNNFPCAPR